MATSTTATTTATTTTTTTNSGHTCSFPSPSSTSPFPSSTTAAAGTAVNAAAARRCRGHHGYRHPVRLVLDWDGTITRSDTTALIGAAAIELNPQPRAAAKNKNNKSNNNNNSQDDVSEPGSVIMARCGEAYMADLAAAQQAEEEERLNVNAVAKFAKSSGSTTNNDTTTTTTTTTTTRCTASTTSAGSAPSASAIAIELTQLDARQDAERASFLRVRAAALGDPHVSSTFTSQSSPDPPSPQSGWWNAMRLAGSKAVADGTVRIRDVDGLKALLSWADGCNHLEQAHDLDTEHKDANQIERSYEGDGKDSNHDGAGWIIVSVSWSRAFIVGALQAAGLAGQSPAEQARVCQRIYCNELLGELPLDNQGRLGLVQVAGDKLRTMKKAVRAATVVAGGDDISQVDSRSVIIYIGDSTTDLGCLLASSVGICMRDGEVKAENDKLRQALNRLQIDCSHIGQVPSSSLNWPTHLNPQSAQTMIAWTNTFRDVSDKLRTLKLIV